MLTWGNVMRVTCILSCTLPSTGTGNGTTYTNTQVAGNTVNITSGRDTTLKGAVVTGNTVNANIGGDLKIQSLQDTPASRREQPSISARRLARRVGSVISAFVWGRRER